MPLSIKLLNLIFLPVCVLITGCTTTFTDADKLSTEITHQFNEGTLNITASVKNNSSKTVTFVNHPDFHSISVYPIERSKAEYLSDPMLISYIRATKEDFSVVAPGETAEFRKLLEINKTGEQVYEISGERRYREQPFLKIQGNQLKATFRYGKYPDYLPKNAAWIGRNYAMVDLNAETIIELPE